MVLGVLKMIIKKNGKKFIGEISVPGDKSISHRSIIFGSLAEGETTVENFLMGEDCISTINCFRDMGVEITYKNTDVKIKGVGLKGLKKPGKTLDAGNSGTTIRILAGILACQDFESEIDGDDSLRKRPMSRVAEPINQMGGDVRCTDKKFPPVKIHPSKEIKGIKYIQPTASAQVKSCLLMAGMYAEGKVEIVQPSISRDHTERMMQHFGIPIEIEGKNVSICKTKQFKGKHIFVPGDISTAAFYMVAACIVEGSDVLIKDVGLNPTRTGIIDVLKDMGASITVENERIMNEEIIGDLRIKGSRLKGITIEGDTIPRIIDEIPIIALAAVFAEGTTVINDAEELKVKETDRIEAVCAELSKMGALITPKHDGMIINGTQRLMGAEVKTYGDHRMGMMLALAGGFAEGETKIDNIDCINVSNPVFFELLEKLINN
jgi:3-phosphoshikimate 1-carboxyvinyltransferase